MFIRQYCIFPSYFNHMPCQTCFFRCLTSRSRFSQNWPRVDWVRVKSTHFRISVEPQSIQLLDQMGESELESVSKSWTKLSYPTSSSFRHMCSKSYLLEEGRNRTSIENLLTILEEFILICIPQHTIHPKKEYRIRKCMKYTFYKTATTVQNPV